MWKKNRYDLYSEKSIISWYDDEGEVEVLGKSVDEVDEGREM